MIEKQMKLLSCSFFPLLFKENRVKSPKRGQVDASTSTQAQYDPATREGKYGYGGDNAPLLWPAYDDEQDEATR